MNYLLIDTSNQPLSVAVMTDKTVLAEHHTNIKKNHSVQLMPAIAQVIEASTIEKKDLDAIVVAKGPGSYTGLRIGVTVAKTLAYALNTKLYGVSSLKALAATVENEQRLLVPVFDARREAVYTGVYQYQAGELVIVMPDQYMPIETLINTLHDMQQDYVFVGYEVEKLSGQLDAEMIEQLPQASAMQPYAETPEDIATFVPNYIKLAEAERNWLNQQKKD
ncbi:tRNA (adenosine(37)-N6)-threonylcarbamoyltransferase complex dimerization subunit type 1 TsaB [Staphylococcus auricularis]|uniref:tRNA (Adenosine(37)-N6)-threonylcarbamoyltransferase complex dimerization subunit type 1 TsaB n=1 Tax=Staphylococcus auricularis TaxID=29379 RepID=A0ABX5IDS0_9STAP|nr:tRNA (adenosine(37)-N6)-threonylcarbamoyltransferase complex dimerization subunit type 1 TsaB [Staphylococcus auricularis]MCE5039067.1 tRNA (adenosine(37)-N6)-threonylcarbamoyltransferase complex dimerization subunit type 1 TsaB [Staphylococcus auricularis]MEB6570929.1 tRNA (adenosine(37)-N6)-threonylcarbamoyltransferase complex dimerization subunit type 1 TsaB [Staphylococcus auricularis]PTH17806.1 tRNA (adenosine(37)-N6)-threonylcarbamoyltransferase complex dimerization subunit type 1 TsaB 